MSADPGGRDSVKQAASRWAKSYSDMPEQCRADAFDSFLAGAEWTRAESSSLEQAVVEAARRLVTAVAALDAAAPLEATTLDPPA